MIWRSSIIPRMGRLPDSLASRKIFEASVCPKCDDMSALLQPCSDTIESCAGAGCVESKLTPGAFPTEARQGPAEPSQALPGPAGARHGPPRPCRGPPRPCRGPPRPCRALPRPGRYRTYPYLGKERRVDLQILEDFHEFEEVQRCASLAERA